MLNAICSFIKLFTGAQARWLGEECPVEGVTPLQSSPSSADSNLFLTDNARPRIYYANHTSHADCMVLLSVLPRHIRKMVRPAAAEDYWMATPLRRWFALRILNIIPIARSQLTKANNPIQRLVVALDEGSSIIIFPQGGRQDDGEVGEFKCGLYHLCRRRPEIELVPTYIDNANRVLPKGSHIPIPVVCSVTFGAPIRLLDGESKEDFLKRAQNAVARCAA